MGWCAWAYRGSFFFLDLPWWITPFSKRISMHCTAPARLLASLFFINQSTTSRPIKQQGYIRRWYRLSRIIGGSCSLCNRLLKCSPTKMICKALRESWSFIFNNENIKYVPHSQKNCAKSTQLYKNPHSCYMISSWGIRNLEVEGKEEGGLGWSCPLPTDWVTRWGTERLTEWLTHCLTDKETAYLSTW